MHSSQILSLLKLTDLMNEYIYVDLLNIWYCKIKINNETKIVVEK